MDAKMVVEQAQAEPEATRDEPLPAQVSALIRGWVLDGLAAERDRSTTSLREAIEHLAADAERLRRLAATDDNAA